MTTDLEAMTLEELVRKAITDGYADGYTENDYGIGIRNCCGTDVDLEPHDSDCWVQAARKLLNMPEE